MVGILIIPCVVGSHFEAPVTHRCAPVSPVSFPHVQLLLLEGSRRFDHVQEDTSLYDAGKGCALELGKKRHHEDIFSPLFVVACEKRSRKEDVTCPAHHSRLSGF
jgi:hypothetical protein